MRQRWLCTGRIGCASHAGHDAGSDGSSPHATLCTAAWGGCAAHSRARAVGTALRSAHGNVHRRAWMVESGWSRRLWRRPARAPDAVAVCPVVYSLLLRLQAFAELGQGRMARARETRFEYGRNLGQTPLYSPRMCKKRVQYLWRLQSTVLERGEQYSRTSVLIPGVSFFECLGYY